MSTRPTTAGSDLADVDRPKAHSLRSHGVGVVARLYATPSLHRLAPAAVGVKLAELRGAAEWIAVPWRRRDALTRAELTLGLPQDDPRTRRWARRQLQEHAVQTELSWRPWLAPSIAIDGLEHLETARAAGRGVILAAVHIGPILGLFHGLAARGLRLYISGGTRPSKPLPPGYVGHWIAVQNRWVEEAGCRWVYRGGSYPLLRTLLERGEICLLMFDVPGRTETSPAVRFGGRRVRLAAGVTSLARETGAPIVPTWVVRRGARQKVRLLEPVDAASFPGDSELAQALADLLWEPFRDHGPQAHPQMAVVWRQAAV